MRDVTLPSGAVLKITPAPFVDAKALYQSVLAEFRGVAVSAETDMAAIFKELICIGFSAPQIEKCLWKCFERCLYVPDGKEPEKFTNLTFDPVERRDDWLACCMEVAQDNIFPFMKSLYALFTQALAAQRSTPEPKPPTMP